MSQYSFKNFRFFLEKLFNRLVSLGLVTGITTKAQVASSLRLGDNMLNLEGNIFNAAVSAFSVPFLEYIFLNFKTEQLASLIFNSRNFKVLELLQIKTHQFLRNGGDGAKLPDSSDKGFNVGNPALTLRVATTRLYGFCLRNGV